MPRYVVTTRRAKKGVAPSARDVVMSEPGIQVLAGDNPDTVTIEANEQAAEHLRDKLRDTHIVEPEIRRSLE